MEAKQEAGRAHAENATLSQQVEQLRRDVYTLQAALQSVIDLGGMTNVSPEIRALSGVQGDPLEPGQRAMRQQVHQQRTARGL